VVVIPKGNESTAIDPLYAIDALGTEQFAMVVAVIAMGMVDVAIDEKVRVIAVRHGGVPTSGGVPMIFCVCRTLMVDRASVGIGRVNVEAMFVDVVAVHTMKMSVVEVVDVASVPYRRVFAIAVHVVVGRMRRVACHGHSVRVQRPSALSLKRNAIRASS
jgi:hypothetical protein